MKWDSGLDPECSGVVSQKPQYPDKANETKARWGSELHAGTTYQWSSLTNGVVHAVQKSCVDPRR